VTDATLQIGTVLSLAGTFAFTRAGGRTVFMDNGQRRTMALTTVAARDVSIRAGLHADQTDADGFLGVQLTGGALGLMLLQDTQGGGTFVGLKAQADALSLIGVPGLTASARTMELTYTQGFGQGPLQNAVVDFTRGDIDGDGRANGHTSIAVRGQELFSLSTRANTLEASASLDLALRAPDAAPDGTPLFQGQGNFKLLKTGDDLVLAGTQIQAEVNLGTNMQAGVRNGLALMVLTPTGMALGMEATAVLSLPGVAGVTAFGEFGLDLNLSSQSVKQSLVVGGRTLAIDFAPGERDFRLGEIDVTIGSGFGQQLADVALHLSEAAAQLREDGRLPVIGQSLDELLDLSSLLGIGDHMLHYLSPVLPSAGYQPQITGLSVVDYGQVGQPSFRGMLQYLNNAWLKPQLASGPGLTLALGGEGVVLDFEGVFTRQLAFGLDLASEVEGLGLDFKGQAQVAGDLKAALDFDFRFDWVSGAQFHLNQLALDGRFEAKDFVIGAALGPIEASIGRNGKDNEGQDWRRGQASLGFTGALSFVNGNFELQKASAPVEIDLPLYGSIAGVELVEKAALTPLVVLRGDVFKPAGQGGISFATQHFERLAQLGKLNLVEVLGALPKMLESLQAMDLQALGIGQLPFVEQSLSSMLDLAAAFQAGVLDKIDFDRPRVAWEPSLRETQQATGKARVLSDGVTVTGVAGQFARSMEGYWITQGARTVQISAVSEDGATLTLAKPLMATQTDMAYEVHRAVERIKTMDEFVAALNQSGLLGDNLATYDAQTGELKVPVRFGHAFAPLSTPIQLGFGGANQAVQLSTQATGQVHIDLAAGFDLILVLNDKLDVAFDRFQAEASVALDVTDLEVLARLGFAGLVAGGAGSGSGLRLAAEAKVALDRTPKAGGGADFSDGGGRFTLGQLSDALGAVTFDIGGTARASLQGLSLLSGSRTVPVPNAPPLAIVVQNLVDFSGLKTVYAQGDLTVDELIAQARRNGAIGANDVVIVLPDLAELTRLQSLSFADIVGAVRVGLDFVTGAIENQPFYTQPLPVINQSLQGLIGVGDQWIAALEAVGNNPVAGLDEAERLLENALGLSPDLLDLTLDTASGQLYIDLQLSLGYRNAFPLALDVQTVARLAGLTLPEGLTDLLDASGEGLIGLAFGAEAQLRLAVDLPSETRALAVRLEDFDALTGKGTRLALNARMVAEDVHLNFLVGPLNLRVQGGSLVFDADGKPETDLAAALQIALVQGKPEVQLIGAFDLTLPTSAVLLGRDVPVGNLVLRTLPEHGEQGLAKFLDLLVGNSLPGDTFPLDFRLPDLNLPEVGQNALIDLLYDPSFVLDGIDLGLGVVQDLFQLGLTADLPFVGRGLADAGQLLSSLRGGLLLDLRTQLAGPGKPVELIQSTLLKVFHEDLNILRDYNGDNKIDLLDIDVGFYDQKGQRVSTWVPGQALPKGGVDAIQFDMDLGGRFLGLGVDIPLAFDIPGFNLDINGGFALSADWRFDFGFGLSATEGFYLATNADGSEELTLELKAYLDGTPQDLNVLTPFEGEGQLLVFNAKVRDLDRDQNRANGFQPSGFGGKLAVDLKGNRAHRMTLDTVLANPKGALSLDFGLGAHLHLGVELGVTGLPSLLGDFVVDWDWRWGDSQVSLPDISLKNIRLDLESTVTDLLLPIAKQISETVQPLREVVAALTTPIVGLDLVPALKSDPTLRGVIDLVWELTAPDKPSIDWAFLDAVQFALDMPKMLQGLMAIGGGLPLGSLLHIGRPDFKVVPGEALDSQGNEETFLIDRFNAELSRVQQQSMGGQKPTAERSGLQFKPYVFDLGNIAKIFTGGSATLFTYELPYLNFDFAGFEVLLAEPSVLELTGGLVPIPVSVPIYAFGGVRAFADLSFGFDTYGVAKAKATGNLLHLFDGFYVNDWSLPDFRNGAFVPGTGGREKPELGISIEIGLKAGIGIKPVLQLGLGAGLQLNVDLDLNDIKVGTVTRDNEGQFVTVQYQGDGRVRPSEILAMLSYPGPIPGLPGGPLNLFDVKFTPYINGYVWGKFGVAPLALKFNVQVFSLKLGEINMLAPLVQPVLGAVDGEGTLTLFAGSRADQRLYLNTDDDAEHWILSGRRPGEVDVEFMGFVQRFQGVHKVVVDLGAGNDRLDASRLINTVELDVQGGAGNDTVSLGAGGGRVIDLQGDNTLRALASSTAPVILIAGSGNDTLSGGLGHDVLYGGAGFNDLSGLGGNDTLYAIQGVNKLNGGDGQDTYVFTGQLGVNTLLENGRDASHLDFSGFLPPEILGVVGPLPMAPTVSIPASFTAIRGGHARLFFYGSPFTGDSQTQATVTLSAPTGAFVASTANGVTVSGGGGAKTTFTGSIEQLNRYFTSGVIAYRYDATLDIQVMQVEVRQGDFTARTSAPIQAMRTSSVAHNWRDLAAADGVLVAVSTAGAGQAGIYLSRDRGQTWSPADVPLGMGFDAVSVTADGQRMAAFSFQGRLALSNDGGQTWVLSQAPADNYSEALVLADGRVLVGDQTGREWFFKNIFNWGQRNTPANLRLFDHSSANPQWSVTAGPNANWRALTLNQDGSAVLAVAGPASNGAASGGVYLGKVSDTGAIVWTNETRGLKANGHWVAVDMDAAGRYRVVAEAGGDLYLADTAAADWVWRPLGLVRSWTSVWMSDDAQTLVATANGGNGGVWLSRNGGLNWLRVAGEGQMGIEAGLDWRGAYFDVRTGQVVAMAANRPLYTFAPPVTSAAPTLDLPPKLEVSGRQPTALPWVSTMLADADSSRLTLTLAADSGRVVATQTPTDTELLRATVLSSTPSSLNSPANERVDLAFDGNARTKYLNFEGPGSGMIMALSAAEAVQALQFTARTNDNIAEWDPTSFTLYGAHTALSWESGDWVKVGSGATGLNGNRGDVRTVAVANTVAYAYYKLVFDDVRGSKDGKEYVHVADVALLAPALQVQQNGDALVLSGSQAALSAYLAAGHVQFHPSPAGAKGTLTVTAYDGLQTTRQQVELVQMDPFALRATWNAGQFEVFALDTNGLRVNRAAVDTVRLGALSDHLQVLRFGDRPLTVQASGGADTVSVFLGNTRGTAMRSIGLMETAAEGETPLLANDTLTVQLPELASSTTQNRIRLGSGELVSGIERITWDETLGVLEIVGDTIKIEALDPSGRIDLGAHTLLRIRAERVSIVGDVYAGGFDLQVANPRNFRIEGQLYKHGDTSGEPILPLGAVVALPPVEGDAFDLGSLGASPYAALIQPADPTAPISLGGTSGGLFLDPAQLLGLNRPALVLGAKGASNPVDIGGGSSGPIVLTVPLVIQSTGSGGQVQLAGQLQGTELEILGPGNTTRFVDGTQVVMSEAILIDDAVRAQGSVRLQAGSLSDPASLTITGRVNGGEGAADVLDLSAPGGVIQIDGRVGDGIARVALLSGGQRYVDGVYDKVWLSGGSGSGATARITVTAGAVTDVQLISAGGGYRAGEVLSANRSSFGDLNSVASGFALRIEALADFEGLRIQDALDVTFGERVYVEGDIVIHATGTVTFSDQVVLRGGGQLMITGAAQVLFLNGIVSDGPQALDYRHASGGAVEFSGGLLPGALDAARLTGVTHLQLASPSGGTALPSLTLTGHAVHLAPVAGHGTLRLAVDRLDLQATHFSMAAASGSLTLAFSANDLRVVTQVHTGSLAAPITGDFQRVSVAAGVADHQVGDIHLRTTANTQTVRAGVLADGDVHWRTEGTLQVASNTQIASTGAGQVRLLSDAGLVMAPSSAISTRSGDIAITTAAQMQIHRIVSAEGRVSLDAGGHLGVIGSGDLPQIVTGGDLHIQSNVGVGGYGFDRLYVDVKALTGLNRVTGDVVISGWKGLDIGPAGYHSNADRGWLVLMSGRIGRVETEGAVTALDNRVARISGKTILMPSVLAQRGMHGFNGHVVMPPREPAPAAPPTLESLNASLRQAWLDALSSPVDSVGAATLRSPLLGTVPGRQTAGVDSVAFDALGSPLDTSALLEAALQAARQSAREEVFGADPLSSWAQRSPAQRNRDGASVQTPAAPWVPAEDRSTPSATEDAPLQQPAPAPAPAEGEAAAAWWPGEGWSPEDLAALEESLRQLQVAPSASLPETPVAEKEAEPA
jgi:hypothetical protein